MPPKRAVEGLKIAEDCILQIGKQNNVIRWKEQMQTIVTEQYGIIGMFFSTNQRYVIPKSPKDISESSSEAESTESESDRETGPSSGPFTASSSSAEPDRIAERMARRAVKQKARKVSDYPVTLGYVCCIIVAAVAISTYMYVHLYSRSYIHNGVA